MSNKMFLKKWIKRVLIFSIFFSVLRIDTAMGIERVYSSSNLIRRAYQSEEINYPTYIVQRIRAAFAPQTVEDRFRSLVSPEPSRDMTILLDEASKHWEDFSQEDQKFLSQFFKRPTDVTFSDPDLGVFNYGTNTIGTYTKGNFKFWYTIENNPDGGGHRHNVNSTDSNSNGTPDYVENMASVFENVYNQEISTMNYSAPPDDPGGANYGGDTKFDIYIMDCGVGGIYGWVTREGLATGGDGNSYYSFMVMDNTYTEFAGHTPTENMQVTAAHEYHHAVQNGINGLAKSWYKECTSTWMEDQVYDAVDDNLQYLNGTGANDFFYHPEISLDKSGDHWYGSWIWNEYLETKYNQSAIKNIWDQLNPVGKDEPLDGIVTVLAGKGTNLNDAFSEFTAKNYNQTGFYKDADKYDKPPFSSPSPHTLGFWPYSPKVDEVTVAAGQIPHLASRYYKFAPAITLVEPRTLQIKVDGPTGKDWSAWVLVKPFIGAIQEYKIDLSKKKIEINNFGILRISEVILVLSNGEKTDNLEFKYSASLARPIAFVIDDTGSMGDEIAGVRTTVLAKIDQFAATGDLYQYTLITYKDYVQYRGQTTDPDVIKGWVSGLYASGGGDCPEAGYDALDKCAEVTPGSEAWWMTDADSHGDWTRLFATVVKLKLAQVTVHSVIMGNCSGEWKGKKCLSSSNTGEGLCILASTDIPADEAAYVISNETGGLNFKVSSGEVPDAVEIIMEEMNKDAVVYISDSTGTNTYEISVDSSISEARFGLVVSPESNLSLAIFNPGGTQILPGDSGVTYIEAGNNKYYIVGTPTSGIWKAKITGTGTYTFSSSAKTPVNIQYLSKTSIGKGNMVPVIVALQGTITSPIFSIVKTDGSSAADITLYDDGLHGDEGAGDGIYANTHIFSQLGGFRLKLAGDNFLSRQDPVKINVGNVDVVAPSDITLNPGSSTTHTFLIKNMSSVETTYDILVTTSKGWADISGVPPTLTVATGSTETIDIPVTVPIDVILGSYDELTITVSDQANPSIMDSDSVLTKTSPISDTTPPTTPVITDDGDVTSDNTHLHASWISNDPESGIVEYQYAIGTTIGTTNVVPWISVGVNTEVIHDFSGQPLINGQTYYFLVKARNDVDLWSEIGNSNGIVVTGTTASLAAETLSDVYVYPNPCRIYKGDTQIHFKKLTAQANIKIFNIAGELVKEIEHTNGTDEEVWTNPGKIASGVYIYLITNNQGQKAIGKLGIIK